MPHKELYITRPLIPDLNKLYDILSNVWASGQLTNAGVMHGRLEVALREYLHVPNISLFNNGTTALMVAIKALGISGEVITTPFTFPATPHALAWQGVKPVFCDIDSVTMNIDPNKIESLITDETTGILATHTFGVLCDVHKIQEIAEDYGLQVIYDAAHAFAPDVGNYGDISMFSFHATKLFHTVEGGALTFTDPGLKSKVELLKNFGIRDEEHVDLVGINGKMNEIQAAIGLLVLDMVEEERAKRRVLYDTYVDCLDGIEGIGLPLRTHSYQYFVITIDEKVFGQSRDAVYESLKKSNVFARKYFYPLCSDYACYQESGLNNLQVAQKVAKEVLCLPFHGELSVDDVQRVCNLIRRK